MREDGRKVVHRDSWLSPALPLARISIASVVGHDCLLPPCSGAVLGGAPILTSDFGARKYTVDGPLPGAQPDLKGGDGVVDEPKDAGDEQRNADRGCASCPLALLDRRHARSLAPRAQRLTGAAHRYHPAMPPNDDIEALRAELRRLWRATRPGRWEAVEVSAAARADLYRVAPDGSRWIVAMPNRIEDARLMAAMREAVPRLFRALDQARGAVPVLGEVREDGRVTWRGRAPDVHPA